MRQHLSVTSPKLWPKRVEVSEFAFSLADEVTLLDLEVIQRMDLLLITMECLIIIGYNHSNLQ
jgi:hypothetical protein